MIRLCVPLTGSTCEQMQADLATAAAAGADVVELRLDYLQDWDEAAVTRLLDAAARFPGEVIATYRTAAEGGHYDGNEDERISRLEFVGLHEAVDYIDVEYESWRKSANIQQKIGLVCEVWDRLPAGHSDRQDAGPTPESSPAIRSDSTTRSRKQLILSKHNFASTPFDLDPMLAAVARERPHVVKIACKAATVVDAVRMLDELRRSAAARPTIALSMGEPGIITRVMARKFGALLTFASLDAGKESAPGQVTLADMRNLYRWEAIGPATLIYGVIGCPVGHSMSPAILNAAFGRENVDAVYLPFRVEPDYNSFASFIDACVRRPWLGLRGCSVTIPHKENLLRYVERRGGYVEPLAARIGAANTLVIEPGEHEDGTDAQVSAYNTDYRGAMDALLAGMNRTREQMASVSVAVFGAGGVSRAIVAGLRDCGCAVTIYNRTHAKAESLAAEFSAEALPWEDRVRQGADVIINCTSIGMTPKADETPMPVEGLAGKPMVFDTVYNPIETRLLREARQCGCPSVDGVAMFIGQAAAQFERWTGQAAPVDLMREVVICRLTQGVS